MTGAKRTEPWVPVGHPEFKWNVGSDVQATWRKYGWVPPSEQREPPPPEIIKESGWNSESAVK